MSRIVPVKLHKDALEVLSEFVSEFVRINYNRLTRLHGEDNVKVFDFKGKRRLFSNGTNETELLFKVTNPTLTKFNSIIIGNYLSQDFDREGDLRTIVDTLYDACKIESTFFRGKSKVTMKEIAVETVTELMEDVNKHGGIPIMPMRNVNAESYTKIMTFLGYIYGQLYVTNKKSAQPDMIAVLSYIEELCRIHIGAEHREMYTTTLRSIKSNTVRKHAAQDYVEYMHPENKPKKTTRKKAEPKETKPTIDDDDDLDGLEDEVDDATKVDDDLDELKDETPKEPLNEEADDDLLGLKED